MSRRLALVAAMGAVLLLPSPAAAITAVINIQNANDFVNGSLTLMFGNSVDWHNNGSTHHTTTADLSSQLNLWDVDLPGGSTSGAVLFPRAGTFAYHCDIHDSMRDIIRVTMTSSDSDPVIGQQVTITFASQAAPSGFTQQIQKRKKGGTWKLFATSAGTSVNWTPARAKHFQFRSRYRNINSGVSTPWSPILNVVVAAS